MHAQDLDTLGSTKEGGGDRSRQAIGGRSSGEMADEALARGAKHHGAAEAMENAEGTNKRQIVLQRLSKTNAGIDDEARTGDTCPLAGLDPRLEGIVNVEHHVVVPGRL